MSEFFKAAEVLEIAIRIEENGEIFYRQVSEKIEEESLRELFTYLADEDAKHRKIFENLLSTLEEYQAPESYSGEYSAYLENFAAEYVFTKEKTGQLMAERIRTEESAVKFGIEIENESVLFYLWIKNFVSVRQREAINMIIDEEHSHYLKLREVQRTLQQNKEGAPKRNRK